jgi:CheY-like chemotaxis protein
VAKAFEPFFTTKNVGEGTGLGLSTIYGFVKQTGGHVKIYSEVGQGTVVKIYLPRSLEETALTAASAALPQMATSNRRNEVVLIVEDDELVRDYGVNALHELGFGTLEANDAASALKVIDEQPVIDLLFTDVGLPGGVNGRQLADEVRKRRPNTKILFMTGYTRNAIIHNGILDHGVELLTKPFTLEALAKKLGQLLPEH